MDKLLAQVDSESIDPDRLVVDLYFEFCIMWNQTNGGRRWAQAECLLDDSGGVWELACEDMIDFTGLAELVCQLRRHRGRRRGRVLHTGDKKLRVLVCFVAEPLD